MDATAEGHSRGRLPHLTDAAALAATAIVAAHAVTDAFIAPEPGVRPADHMLSGVAPLALLVAACGAFWLSRAGLRAAGSLLLGILALEGFALAVADAGTVGARGDDWTGFALAPAGLTLIVLGIVLLGRSRKPQGRWGYSDRRSSAQPRCSASTGSSSPLASRCWRRTVPTRPLRPSTSDARRGRSRCGPPMGSICRAVMSRRGTAPRCWSSPAAPAARLKRVRSSATDTAC